MTSFKGPLKTLLHVTVSNTRLQKLFYKAFFPPSSLPGTTFSCLFILSGSGKPGLECHREEKAPLDAVVTNRQPSQHVPAWFYSKKKKLDIPKVKGFEWPETTLKIFWKKY